MREMHEEEGLAMHREEEFVTLVSLIVLVFSLLPYTNSSNREGYLKESKRVKYMTSGIG